MLSFPALAAPVAELQEFCHNTLGGNLGIEFMEATPEYLVARMPVDHRTMQPFGVLHGGASVALAETLGSVGGYLLVKDDNKLTVGLEIKANHVRSARSGWVTGKARPVHVGRTTQVWDIDITDDAGNLICLSRLTLVIIDKP